MGDPPTTWRWPYCRCCNCIRSTCWCERVCSESGSMHCIMPRSRLPGTNESRSPHRLATSFGTTYSVACASCEWLQRSEREKPHCGETNQHAPTQTPCNQPAIAVLTHTQTQHTTSIASNSAPYTCLITTSALALQSQHRNANPAPVMRVPAASLGQHWQHLM